MLALVASNLGSAEDRLQLEATCRTLLAASRGEHGGTWWGGRRLSLSLLRVRLGHLPFERWQEAEQAYAESVSAWLAARRPQPALLEVDGLESEVQLPAPTLPFPPRECAAGGRCLHVRARPQQLAVRLLLTAVRHARRGTPCTCVLHPTHKVQSACRHCTTTTWASAGGRGTR